MNSTTLLVSLAAVPIIAVLVYVAAIVRKRIRKNRFAEYAWEVHRFELAREGVVEYANWLHPKEKMKPLEQERVDALREFIRPGDLAIDIGAYTGDTSIPMALAAGKNGCVIALEPNRYVFKVLEKNASLNRDKTNLILLNIAATETEGTFTFHYSDGSFCNGGFVSQLKNQRHGHNHSLEVRGRNLSQLLRREYAEQLKRLSFIKVDAEGYDRSVIQSLADILREFQPVVMCEVYKRLDATEREALYDVLAGLGYQCFKLSDGPRLAGETVSREKMNDWKHFDIVALPKKMKQQRAA